jgi:hypothetical protein
MSVYVTARHINLEVDRLSATNLAIKIQTDKTLVDFTQDLTRKAKNIVTLQIIITNNATLTSIS